MNLFHLELPEDVRVDGPHALLVAAVDESTAKELADARFDGDVSWADAADATTLASDAPSGPDFEGYRFVVRVSAKPPAIDADTTVPTDPDVTAEYTGAPADGIDEVGEGLKAALLLATFADGSTLACAGADWDLATRVLKVAETTDGLGDRSVRVDVFLPGAKGPYSTAGGQFVNQMTHQGDDGDALTVEFKGVAADAATYENWVFTVRVDTATGTPFSATGGADDTLDDVMALLVTALNGSADIDAAAWSASTRVLTVAGAADGLGDQGVEIDVYSPTEDADQSKGLVTAVVSGGASGDALTIAFAAKASDDIIPVVTEL
jgi:hypothetical protein